MLQEGQAEAENGRDVVIGYLEPHRRPETAAQADGLELVPRRRVVYRDVALDEMDLPAILARRPELCLIDELAHTNAPGVEHAKRYEDVRDVLDAGIDVYSTVNVQHLESLNDQIAELTGTRVRETLPDGVLGEADEVVLIDLTPEALIERLRAGQGLSGGARRGGAEQLLQGREPRRAARGRAAPGRRGGRGQAAGARDRPGARRRRGLLESAAPQAVGERLLALVKPTPKSQRVVRRAWRSAQRLQAELDILWVSARRAERGGARAARRAAPARHRARRAPARRARRRRRRDGPPRRRRARHDLRADGHAAAAQRARAPRRGPRCRSGCSRCCPASTCASSPTAAAARSSLDDRSLDRRARARPRRARRRSTCATAGAHAHARAVRDGGSSSRSPATRCRAARSTPRCGSRSPSTRRSCPCSSRACR